MGAEWVLQITINLISEEAAVNEWVAIGTLITFAQSLQIHTSGTFLEGEKAQRPGI